MLRYIGERKDQHPVLALSLLIDRLLRFHARCFCPACGSLSERASELVQVVPGCLRLPTKSL